MVFSNNTDYFNYLYDGKNLGTERWHPVVAGFDVLWLTVLPMAAPLVLFGALLAVCKVGLVLAVFG